MDASDISDNFSIQQYMAQSYIWYVAAIHSEYIHLYMNSLPSKITSLLLKVFLSNSDYVVY